MSFELERVKSKDASSAGQLARPEADAEASSEMSVSRRKREVKTVERGGLLSFNTHDRSLAPLVGLDQSMLPTGFERWRSELSALSGMDLLDALTAPNNAAACIQTLPLEDLHHFLFEVGLEDAEGVLALASSEQVQGLLDLELWQQSELSLARLDVWMFALLRAGKDVLYKRVLDLDDSLLNWIVKQNVFAYVVEDPDDFEPPLAEHMMTPDRRLCIVFPRSVDHLEGQTPEQLKETPKDGEDATLELNQQERAERGAERLQERREAPLGGGDRDKPIRVFIDLLLQEQPELCIHLLLAATAALNSTIEEDAYRWRTARLADRGFIEHYEARAIYTPPPVDWKRALPPMRVDEEVPPAKRWLSKVIAGHERLDRAFAALDWTDAVTVAETLGYVANMMLSADRVPLWHRERHEITLKRLQAGLSIALEVLNGPEASPHRDAEALASHHLNHLFRLGYEQMTEAARPVWRVESALRRGDDASAALDGLPRLKLWADALLGEHPEGRGPDGELMTLRSLADCEIARAGALMIEDVARVAQPLYAELLAQAAEGAESEAESPSGAVSMGALLVAAYGRELRNEDTALRPLTSSEARALHQHLFDQPKIEQPHGEISTGVESEGEAPSTGVIRAEASAAISAWWAERGGETKTAPLALLRELAEQMATVPSSAIDPRFIELISWPTPDLS